MVGHGNKRSKRGGYRTEGRLEADIEILSAQTFCLSQDVYIRDSIDYTGAFYLIFLKIMRTI